jgi:hypothetical protein
MHEAGLECQINGRAGKGIGGDTLYAYTFPSAPDMARNVVQITYIGQRKKLSIITTKVQDGVTDPESDALLPPCIQIPDSGQFFPDPGSDTFISETFLHYPCCFIFYDAGLLLRLAPEAVSSKKKVPVGLILHASIGRRRKKLGIIPDLQLRARIRNHSKAINKTFDFLAHFTADIKHVGAFL